MKTQRILMFFLCAALLGAAATTFGQSDGKIANMTAGAGSVRWDVLVSHAGGTLTISAPDGRIFRKVFRSGGGAEINLADKQFDNLPDGVYNYELQLSPVLTAAQKDEIKKARGKDDDPENDRAARKRPIVPSLIQSGSFAIVNGALIGPGAIEGQRTANSNEPAEPKAPPATPPRISANTIMRLRNHRFSLGAMPDQVIADDLIVQGSACAGLDCVNNESFGFDTIRLKENNTRISFVDTSTSTGFPTNDWTIRANSNASGGGNFLAFVDRGATSPGDESGTIVFEVDAGAPANALRVSGSGKIGIRTGTPGLDVHVVSTDTPAFRMEQTSGGGFTAQTWDIGANEANWFVRDLSGGSRLPLRIRPGAPTSSIDIAASGNVGVGTASPGAKLDVTGNVQISTNAATNYVSGRPNLDLTGLFIWHDMAAKNLIPTGVGVAINRAGTAAYFTNAGGFSAIFDAGSVGIGTTAPTDTLSVNGTASKPGGGSWAVFSDERLKNIKGKFTAGLDAVMQIQPLRYQYKQNNQLKLESGKDYIGFGAQALQTVLPEAVSRNANGYLQVNNDPIMWAMLNAIKEQQKEIEQLKDQIRSLRRAPRHRRK